MASTFQWLLRNERRAGMILVFSASHNIGMLRTVPTVSRQQSNRHLSYTRSMTPSKVEQSSSMSLFLPTLPTSTHDAFLYSSMRGLSNQSRHCPFCKQTSSSSKYSFRRENTSISPQCFLGDQSMRCLQTFGGALYAGHNKWSKVKYIKGPKDIEKSKQFTRIGIQLKVAVKEGGPNPETNSSLAALISLAKSKSMPKATIDSMIKKASISKQGDSQQTFEVRGPANSSLLVTVLTDNAKRTRTELSQLASKNGGVFGEQGTAMFAFEKKGVVRIPCETEDHTLMNLDEAEELAIDTGAEEVSVTSDEDGQNIFMFICDPSDLRSVRDGLAERSHQVQSYGLEFVPQTTIALEDSDLSAVAGLINAFESHEEVVKVYDNVTSKE